MEEMLESIFKDEKNEANQNRWHQGCVLDSTVHSYLGRSKF